MDSVPHSTELSVSTIHIHVWDGWVNALLPHWIIRLLKAGTWTWHILGASIKSSRETRTHAGISTEGIECRELTLVGWKSLNILHGMVR